jgi:ABC-type Fe3+ transport system permease subunit
MLIFSMGFASGALVVVVGLLLARVKRETLGRGDRFLARLGAIGAQRFVGVEQD